MILRTSSSTRGRVLHEQDVGARVDDRDAALGEDRALAAGRRRLPRAGAELLLPVGRDQIARRSGALM